MDSAVGLTDYTPIPLTEDYGVDAMGLNPNGHRAAVQVKFRGNPDDSVTYAELARTFTSGLIKHQLDLMQSSTLYVLTTARDVTPQARHVLGDRIVLIHLDVLKTKVDNNLNFWPFALREVEETLAAPFQS